MCVEMCLEVFRQMRGDTAIRVEFFGDEIDRITEIDMLTGEIKNTLNHIALFFRHPIMLCQGRWRKQLKY